MKTLIGIVLDESSSMECRRSDTIEGFNHFLESQKKVVVDSARLFLVKFHTNVTIVHRGVPLEEVVPLTMENYQPQSCTALYDAISQCIKIMDEEKAADERAICVIMTDGEENSSQNTSAEQIRSIIKSHEQQDDWTFIYIGVEIAEWVKTSGMNLKGCMAGYDIRGGSGRRKGGPPTGKWQSSADLEEMEKLDNAVLDFRCLPRTDPKSTE